MSWKSVKQKSALLSTVESEWYEASETAHMVCSKRDRAQDDARHATMLYVGIKALYFTWHAPGPFCLESVQFTVPLCTRGEGGMEPGAAESLIQILKVCSQ
jgi:hypothetical protein